LPGRIGKVSKPARLTEITQGRRQPEVAISPERQAIGEKFEMPNYIFEAARHRRNMTYVMRYIGTPEIGRSHPKTEVVITP
jgi:hypothetical protein